MNAAAIQQAPSAPKIAPVVKFVDDPDRPLIDRFLAGDASAFVELIRRHERNLKGAVFNLLHSWEDAEEIAQDAFIQVHRNIRGFRGDCTFLTWIFLIARRRSFNLYHKRRRNGYGRSDPLDAPVGSNDGPTLADFLEDRNADFRRDLDLAELESTARDGLWKIAEHHREILGLRWICRMDYEEIAAAMNLELGTVKSRITRARAALKAVLTDEKGR